MTTLGQFKPAVPKYWLFVANGILWSGVGVMLCIIAIKRLMPLGNIKGPAYGAAGLVIAIVVLRGRFGRLALKNINRLNRLPEKVCLFAFQNWKSYLIIIVMVVAGRMLRHMTVQCPLLAVVYTVMGGALILGSFQYYIRLGRIIGKQKQKDSSEAS